MLCFPIQRFMEIHRICCILMFIACSSCNHNNKQKGDSENTLVTCRDGLDNDLDALTDCDDEECIDQPVCREGTRADGDTDSRMATEDNTDTATGLPDEDDTLLEGDTYYDSSADSAIGTDSTNDDSDTDSDTEEPPEDSADSSCFGPVVIDRNARACDLLLDVGERPVDMVRFSTDTRGAVIQRPPRLAISMVTAEDAPFSEDAVCLEGDASHVTLTQADCYDRFGVSLAGENAVMP